jgi:hypothetical protein
MAERKNASLDSLLGDCDDVLYENGDILPCAFTQFLKEGPMRTNKIYLSSFVHISPNRVAHKTNSPLLVTGELATGYAQRIHNHLWIMERLFLKPLFVRIRKNREG